MATSGPDTFSTRSFYGSRTRAQRDRPRVPVIQLNFGDSDKESDYDEDEANIPDEQVIIQAQVKMKVVRMMLMWLKMTLRVLRQKVKLQEAPKLDVLPRM